MPGGAHRRKKNSLPIILKSALHFSQMHMHMSILLSHLLLLVNLFTSRSYILSVSLSAPPATINLPCYPISIWKEFVLWLQAALAPCLVAGCLEKPEALLSSANRTLTFVSCAQHKFPSVNFERPFDSCCLTVLSWRTQQLLGGLFCGWFMFSLWCLKGCCRGKLQKTSKRFYTVEY